MLTFRRLVSLALPALVILSLSPRLLAAEADSDRAAALLKQGLAQFKAMDFNAAKTSLLGVDRDRLSDADQAVLEEHLAKVDSAIAKQSEAMAMYNSAVKALKAGNLAKARDGFAAAAGSEYLPEPLRRDAAAQLALVSKKLQTSTAPTSRPALMVVREPVAETKAGKPAAPVALPQTVAKTPAEEMAELKPEPATRPAFVTARLAAPVAKPSQSVPLPVAAEGVLKPTLAQPPAAEAPVSPTSQPVEVAAGQEKPEFPVPFAKPEEEPATVTTAEGNPKPVGPAPRPSEKTVQVAADKTTEPPAPMPVTVVVREIPAATSQPAPDDAEAARVFSNVLTRRSQANRLVSDGKAALAEGNAETAVRNFQQALAMVPEMEEAKSLLQQAQAQLSANGGEAGPLSVLEQKRRVKRQQSDVEFDKAMARSAELLLGAKNTSDFDNAADAARVGQNAVVANKNLYGASEYNDRMLDVEKRLEGIQKRRQDWERSQVQRQLAQMSKAEAERAQRAKEQLTRKVTSLTESAKALRAEQKYKEALEVVKQIQSLDPSNYWAADQAEMLQQFILLQDQKETVDTSDIQRNLTQRDNLESRIPWYGPLIFARNWREIRQDREGEGLAARYGSQEDRRIRERLQETIDGKMDFEDVPLVDVLDHLRAVTGLNILPNWKYLESAGYTKESAVVSSVHLVKVPYEKALQVILEDVSGPNVGTEQEISYVIDGGVIIITTRQALSRKVFPVVYNIQDLVRALSLVHRDFDNFRDVQGTGTGTGNTGGTTGGTNSGTNGGTSSGTNSNYTSGTSGRNTNGTNGTSSGTSGSITTAGGASTTNGGQTENAQAVVTNIINTITNTIAPESWISAGGDGHIDFWNDQLIVTQTADNHQAIADLITQLREAKDIQIAIEARFITVNTGYLESIGVDLDFYFNLGSPLGSAARTDPWTGATVPTSTGSSAWGSGLPGNSQLTPIAARQNPDFANMLGVSSPLGQNSIGSLVTAPASSLSGTFLDDIQVDFFIRATQAHQSTRTLTAPRVTLLNGTAARIHVGRDLNYVSNVDVTPGTQNGTIVNQPTVAYTTNTLSLGTELFISATVSADLKYVTITVEPSVTQLRALTFFPYDPSTLIAQGKIPDATGFVQLPDTEVETIQTTVNVPDGATLLLGGLKSTGEVEREIGVPLLSKIPIINRAFTNRGKVSDEETLLILLKPNIIIPRDQEKKEFP